MDTYNYLSIIFVNIRIRVLKQHHNTSFFPLIRKNINNSFHKFLNLYLVFYNYDILLV